MRIAIDTGGTFTDCVAMVEGRLRVVKLRSTPGDPGAAVLEGVGRLVGAARTASEGAGAAALGVEVRHGTTVGTNAMLERKGARVAFVTTAGFEDTIAIGRQTRAKLYAWTQAPPVCLVEEGLRFGVPERVTAEGEVLRRPTEAELRVLVESVRASGAEAVAVSLLFAFVNAENERRVVEALEELGLPMSVGHRMLPEFREYERGSTLVVNAYLAPKMEGYLLELEREVEARYAGGRVQVMQSSGGIVGARLAAAEPVRTVLSGPAGGVIGAWEMARVAGFERVIGFDMGGTSTDVFLADVETGGVQLTAESVVAGVPVSVPMLDIHTAGAGGGSLARFDAGGLLRVGPESAGAVPGPVCFGRGMEPTVTDANLLLGRLDGEQFMGGAVVLDAGRARDVFEARRGELESVEAFAAGVLRVVETQMERAIRVISVERGHDPRRFTLVAFGGGGPLHACAVARALRVPKVMIPAMPGALSAVGILLADAVRDFSRTVMLHPDGQRTPGGDPVVSGERMGELEAAFAELEDAAAGEVVVDRGGSCEPRSENPDLGHPGSVAGEVEVDRGGSCEPRSENPDLGHPGSVAGEVVVDRGGSYEPRSENPDLGHPGSVAEASTGSFAGESGGWEVERSLDVRYRGQGYELNVPYKEGAEERFHAMHAQRYGFAHRERAVEIVNVRVRLRVRSEGYEAVREEMRAGDGMQALRGEREVWFDGGWVQARVFDRERLRAGDVVMGPALVTEYTSATVVPPGARLEVDVWGNLVVDVNAEVQ